MDDAKPCVFCERPMPWKAGDVCAECERTREKGEIIAEWTLDLKRGTLRKR